MIYQGSCNCGKWQVKITVKTPLSDLNPRVCDCEYCQNHPSAIVSDLNMIIDFIGGTAKINQNGDQLANFYYCIGCGDLLAVGHNINGVLRGAVNSQLLEDVDEFGEPVQNQPRFLKSSEKLESWEGLWGVLNCV